MSTDVNTVKPRDYNLGVPFRSQSRLQKGNKRAQSRLSVLGRVDQEGECEIGYVSVFLISLFTAEPFN